MELDQLLGNMNPDLFLEREKKQFSIKDTFGLNLGTEVDSKGRVVQEGHLPKLKDKLIGGYKYPTAFTPKINEDYVFPHQDTLAFLLGIIMKDNILITGHSGSGKTSLAEQVAARLNWSVVKINFDRSVSKDNLIGEYLLKDKSTYFQPGLLLMAFCMPGTIILLDEWDTISDECSFVLQRPLQRDDRKIVVLETGGTVVPIHEDNIIVATANTNGQGDDTGLYSHGTSIQNYAQINRFSLSIKISELEESKECEMLARRFPQIEKTEQEFLVRSIRSLRDGFLNGALSVPLSRRDLLNWAEKYIVLGDPLKAAKYCFLNRMTDQDAMVAEQTIQRVFIEK